MAGSYSDEFKEQVLKECREVGNVALVARRHEISKNTVYTWKNRVKKNGSVKTPTGNENHKFKKVQKRLQEVNTENNQLKKLIAEKELELSILRDLRDRAANPQ